MAGALTASNGAIKKLVIFGVGAFARVVHFSFCEDSCHEVVAFTVHSRFLSDKTFRGLEVVPFETIDHVYPPDQYAMFVAIGYTGVNKLKAEIYNECKQKGYELVTYINSGNSHWNDLQIGDNCFIFDNNMIQPFVRIARNVFLGSGNHIGHDTVIGDHCYISGHVVIPGNVTVGPYCFIGANATLRDGVTIAPECIIGAGALILNDTVERGVYIAKGTEKIALQSDAISRLFL